MPKKETVKPPVVKVYLGPIIPGVAVTGTVYSNGLPPQLAVAVEEVPAIDSLLVEPAQVAMARKALKTETSAISICYAKAVEYSKRGAKK